MDVDLKLTAVIDIEVPLDILIDRICGRRSCPACKAMYHVIYSPPKKENICDECGTELIRRADDTEEVVKARCEEYLNKTAPLTAYYKEKGLLNSINGAVEIEKLYNSLIDLLQKICHD